MVLGFSLADMMNHIDCFTGVEPALCPRDKSYLVMVPMRISNKPSSYGFEGTINVTYVVQKPKM